MADMVVRFNVRLTPRVVRWGVASLLLLALAGDLATESVTLSTYYPAPSGVYSRMITTGFTYLARDSDRVGIGTTSPQEKVHIIGKVIAGDTLGGGSPGTEPFHSRGSGAGYSLQDRGNAADRWVLYSDGASFRTWNNGFVHLVTQTNGQTGIAGGGGGTDPRATLDVGTWGGGDVLIRKQCTPQSIIPNCPGGQYATLAAGVYTSRWEIGGVDTTGDYTTGTMLCCTCPTGGCVSPF